MKVRYILLIFFLFNGIFSTQAKMFTAISDGNWQDNIWNESGYPGANDDVIIDGYAVTISGATIFTVKNLKLVNNSGLNAPTMLTINNGNLIVTNDLSLISDQNTSPSLTFPIILTINNATLEVQDDFKVMKNASDTSLGEIMIETNGSSILDISDQMVLEYNAASQDINHKISFNDQSSLAVGGIFQSTVYDKNNFAFLFSNAASLTAAGGITMEGYDNSQIDFTHNSTAASNISGDLTVSGYNANGDVSEINLNAGLLNVSGNLNLISDHPTQLVRLNVDGIANKLVVSGDLNLDAQDPNTVSVILNQSSILEVSSEIGRVNAYGNLFMSPEALISFSNISSLPANEIAGDNTDQFEFTNVKLVNTSGQPIQLDGPMTIKYNLELDGGIIKTDSINILVLEQGATISSANETSYIDGPIEKRGSFTNSFFMPLGNKGIYAPLEISPVSDPNSIIRIQYFGDPPPIGGVPPDLDRVDNNQHWIIDRIAGTESINIVMHWTDGERSNISSMDSLTTAYFDSSTGEWKNAGRGTVSGGNAAGQSGSIGSDMLGDPPPIGAVAVTIGTVSTNSVLPIELLVFKAHKENNSVLINWTTSLEIDASHFEIERSLDGIEFDKIGSHTAVGGAAVETIYNFKDKFPTSGTNYYRLRSVDLDESTSVTRILSINFQSLDVPIAVPNPVQDRLQIVGLNLTSSLAIVEVYNPTGQLLFQRARAINNGEIELRTRDINMNSEGTYFLRIIDSARTHNITILKLE